MTVEIALVVALLVAAIVLFTTEALPVDLVALVIMAVLLLTGIISPREGISGFSNEATVTIAAMFVLSAGLFNTGAVNVIGSWLAKIGKVNVWFALIVMMLGIGAISAFINNTAAVAIFLPIVLGLAREVKVSPSKLLIPLSYAAMFGGVCTLIGTSTNILVGSIAQRYGQPPFRMFEFTPLGLAMFGAGLLYMLLIGVRLIPDRRRADELTKNFGMGHYLTEVVLRPDAKSVGKSLRDSPLMADLDLDIIDVIRGGAPLRPLTASITLQAGDILRVRCDVEKVKTLQEREGITLRPDTMLWDRDLKSEDTTLVEAVIAPNAFLEGRTLAQVRFRHHFGATALAIRHRGEVMHENLEHTPLRSGDVLLVRIKTDNLDDLKRDPAFIIASQVGLPEFKRRKIVPAVAIIAGVVAAAALNLLPIMVSALIGCILLILTRCLTMEEAYKGIDWKVIILLAGVITLGSALEKTGAAGLAADAIISTVGSWGPAATVSVLYLLSFLLTEMISNTATAALLAPIAIATAKSMGVDSRPFLMAVAFAASASFMTPVGYQTNTLIYGAGQYRFTDFLRVGTPLNLLFWLMATILIPYFWPFS
jgi:di/tricarboxylate transporter